ncbi:Uma2 family endonuclease [Anatilimnocola floriformis]|uniref:Uma2 family endonuclease n=1 Tax=Anatilimnocola floriformis TaxID=2948575 RepID=UPI0020C2692C|nr:Uma2 family endonuclease [Anatilimnocola floriformis]
MSIDITTRTPETVADLLADLGDIPPSRILLHPAPGTATEEDVLRLEAAPQKRLCELIDGVLVEKAMGFAESLLAAFLINYLWLFVKPRKLGVVLSSDGMLRVLPAQIRIPDVCFISWDRLPGRKIPKAQVPRLAPDLAIEVLSPGNTKKEMERKRTDYFAAGVLECWEVLIPTREIIQYQADGSITRFDETATISTSVLPGFELPVATLFAELDETG